MNPLVLSIPIYPVVGVPSFLHWTGGTPPYFVSIQLLNSEQDLSPANITAVHNVVQWTASETGSQQYCVTSISNSTEMACSQITEVKQKSNGSSARTELSHFEYRVGNGPMNIKLLEESVNITIHLNMSTTTTKDSMLCGTYSTSMVQDSQPSPTRHTLWVDSGSSAHTSSRKSIAGATVGSVSAVLLLVLVVVLVRRRRQRALNAQHDTEAKPSADHLPSSKQDRRSIRKWLARCVSLIDGNEVRPDDQLGSEQDDISECMSSGATVGSQPTVPTTLATKDGSQDQGTALPVTMSTSEPLILPVLHMRPVYAQDAGVRLAGGSPDEAVDTVAPVTRTELQYSTSTLPPPYDSF